MPQHPGKVKKKPKKKKPKAKKRRQAIGSGKYDSSKYDRIIKAIYGPVRIAESK